MCPPHVGFRVEVVPIQALTVGGSFAPANLAVLCPFCRWLVQRQRVSMTALKKFKKDWEAQAAKAPVEYTDNGLTIIGEPLRFETHGRRLATVLEGSEIDQLLTNFFNCLDTFLVHEDQHLENAISLAVIRAFRDQYNYVPPEREIKELSTADSRKLDLLYRGIRTILSTGLASKVRAAAPERKRSAKPKKPAKKVAKKPAKKSAKPKPAKKAVKKSSKKPPKKK
ncbi:MAG: hypothetical protein BIFFINMI_02772 [Phycisphaerae bacterium]|nr:hypothetical protein [Phycisphaerae bacterium]